MRATFNDHPPKCIVIGDGEIGLSGLWWEVAGGWETGDEQHQEVHVEGLFPVPRTLKSKPA